MAKRSAHTYTHVYAKHLVRLVNKNDLKKKLLVLCAE